MKYLKFTGFTTEQDANTMAEPVLHYEITYDTDSVNAPAGDGKTIGTYSPYEGKNTVNNKPESVEIQSGEETAANAGGGEQKLI